MRSALSSTAEDDCGDCGLLIAGRRAVVTAAAVNILMATRLRRIATTKNISVRMIVILGVLGEKFMAFCP